MADEAGFPFLDGLSLLLLAEMLGYEGVLRCDQDGVIELARAFSKGVRRGRETLATIESGAVPLASVELL